MAEKVYIFAKTYDDRPTTDRVFAAGPYPWRVIDAALQERIDALPVDQVTELTALRDVPGQIGDLAALISTGGLAFPTKSAMEEWNDAKPSSLALVFQDEVLLNGLYYRSRNLFNIDDAGVELGRFVNNLNGETIANSTYNSTGFVSLKSNEIYTISYVHSRAFYDASQNYISGEPNGSPATFVAPEGAAFARFTVATASWASFQVELGPLATGFESFGEWYKSVLQIESFPVASKEEAEAGFAVDKSMTPERTRQAVAARPDIVQPKWAGLKSAWVDPFFRAVEVGQGFAGKARWVTPFAGVYTLVPSALFSGRALRRDESSAGQLGGPLMHLDDIGAAPGDTITVRALITGNGVTGGIAFRFVDGGGANVGGQINMPNAAGTSTEVTSATASLRTGTAEVPAGATGARVYSYTTAGTGHIDVQALWACEGAAVDVPVWPVFAGDQAAQAAALDTLNLITPVTGRIPVLEAGQSYLLSSNGAVTPAVTAPDIQLAVTDVLTNDSYGSPFQGWAERYDPAGVSFNAVRLRSIGRKSDVAEANYWRTVRVIVRAAATSDAHLGASSTVVAVGETLVDPSQPVLNDVVVILRDPDTDEVVTLTNSDLGAEYLIGTYFLNADGGAAYGSPHRATQSNALASPQSYYITTGNPLTANWIAFTGNWRLGVDHLLLTDPQDVVVYTPTSGFADDLSGVGSAEAVYNAPALRQYAKRITAGEAATIALLGDSWTNTTFRLHEPLRSRFAAAYGISAPGYISANTDLGIAEGGARTRSGTWTGTRSSTAAVGPDNAHASTTDTAAFITFGSTGTVAKFFVHYLRQPGGGSFSWSIDGGAATVVSTDGVLAYQVLEINGPGTLRIDIDTAGSAGVLLCGCDVRNATAGQVVLHKLGSGGARASHFAGMASGYLEAAYASLAPDVVMISLGTNDHAGSVGLPSFKADISTIIDRVRANVPLADIALVGPGPNGNAGAFEIDDYIAQMYALARELDVAFVSLKAGLGEYADANARGLYGDASHVNEEGGLINGRTLWRALFIE